MSDVITHYILTQHYTNSLKCQCCDGRKAVLQSTYTTASGRDGDTYKFCQQCRNGHIFSYENPAKSYVEDTVILVDQPAQNVNELFRNIYITLSCNYSWALVVANAGAAS